MRILLTICGFGLQFAESAYNLRFPLTICGFHLQLRFLRQLKFPKHIYYYLLMVPQIGSRFHTFYFGFRKNACFWSDFEQYSVLAICPWNPKHLIRSKKISKVADSETNLSFACCEIRLQFTKCAVWPRNVKLPNPNNN